MVDNHVRNFNNSEKFTYIVTAVYASKFKKNTFYIGTRRGLITSIYNNGIWNLTPKNSERIKTEIRSMSEDNDGNLWIGTENGLVKMDQVIF